jgi:hypothetical protein
MPFVALVNERHQALAPDIVLLPLLAILGLVTVITAGRVMRQALATAIQLIETAFALGLLTIMILVTVFVAVCLLVAG